MTFYFLSGIIIEQSMHGRLAQLVEHSLDVRRVSSSSLLTSTTVKEIGFSNLFFLF